MRKMVNPFKKFTINSISKKLNKINFKVSLSHSNPFPKTSLLSHYQFKKQFVKIVPDGSVQGETLEFFRFLMSLSFNLKNR